jgi:hypothetical protein
MRPAISGVTVFPGVGGMQARITGPLGANEEDGPGYFCVRVAPTEEPDESAPEAFGAAVMSRAEFDNAAKQDGGTWAAQVPVTRGTFKNDTVFVGVWALVHSTDGIFESYWYKEAVKLTVADEAPSDQAP